jgi:hypothetical protein
VPVADPSQIAEELPLIQPATVGEKTFTTDAEPVNKQNPPVIAVQVYVPDIARVAFGIVKLVFVVVIE